MDLLWERLCSVFPVLKTNLAIENTLNLTEIEMIGTDLQRHDLLQSVYDLILVELESLLRHQVVPAFWQHFQSSDADSGFSRFQLAVHQLYDDFSRCQEILKRLQQLMAGKLPSRDHDEAAIFQVTLRATLLSQLPVDFNDTVHAFYGKSFRIFVNSQNDDPDESLETMEGELKCRGCELESTECKCDEMVQMFIETNLYLNEMGLLDRLAGFTLTTLIQEQIRSHVQMTCSGRFDEHHLGGLERWLDTIVLHWLTKIYNNGSLDVAASDGKIRAAIETFHVKLNHFLYEVYANHIIDQFFNIIIEYPDSICAIDDLKLCLEKLDLRSHLVRTIKHSLETRLLHPGVDTPDILTGYVAAIKSLKHLDKSGVLLQTVIEPVKEYLRGRNDTVRCVVTGLTEEGPTDLAEELAKSETLKAEETAAVGDEMLNWEDWKPDPIDIESDRGSTKARAGDIISMVVDIYGSKELFVNEYRNLLAERLLSQLDFAPEKEIRNLELLKLRFGETLLHSCEVMLKDISDSKRINAHIQSDSNYCDTRSFEISALIVSSQFWPTFKKESMDLPDAIREQFEFYTKQYEGYKGNRTLNWMPLNGKVTVELELEDRKLELTVTPAQAAIIIHFEQQAEWKLETLSQRMNMPPSILRKRLSFWQAQGLIRESGDGVFALVERQDERHVEVMQTHEAEDDETESLMASASDQREEELQVFWSYIVGMLTNLDSLPLERIHQMLKMFASQGPGFEFSQEELKNFLQRKVREHKLVYSGAVYHLPKP